MTETAETIIARVYVRHADVFTCCVGAKFPLSAATSAWEDYAPIEQACGRFAAQDIIAALDAAGYEIVEKCPPLDLDELRRSLSKLSDEIVERMRDESDKRWKGEPTVRAMIAESQKP